MQGQPQGRGRSALFTDVAAAAATQPAHAQGVERETRAARSRQAALAAPAASDVAATAGGQAAAGKDGVPAAPAAEASRCAPQPLWRVPGQLCRPDGSSASEGRGSRSPACSAASASAPPPIVPSASSKARLPSHPRTCLLAGNLPVKPNKYVEDWGVRREHIENEFRWARGQAHPRGTDQHARALACGGI